MGFVLHYHVFLFGEFILKMHWELSMWWPAARLWQMLQLCVSPTAASAGVVAPHFVHISIHILAILNNREHTYRDAHLRCQSELLIVGLIVWDFDVLSWQLSFCEAALIKGKRMLDFHLPGIPLQTTLLHDCWMAYTQYGCCRLGLEFTCF